MKKIILAIAVLILLAVIIVKVDYRPFHGEVVREYVQGPDAKLYKVFQGKKWIWTIWYGDIPGCHLYLGQQPKVGSRVIGVELTLSWRFNGIFIRDVEIAWFI